VLPLSLYQNLSPAIEAVTLPEISAAPFGRMIPCETVITLESNRLDTPVIGIVTEDVWHDGRLVVPAGAEVHGKATIDPRRERLAVEGRWRIVWRTNDDRNGSELSVSGIALDRDYDGTSARWGEADGSAGLRGEVVRARTDRELRLFAASFLQAAMQSLQEQRVSTGFTGEVAVPLATGRNAALGGTAAVLGEYVTQVREAIERHGFYLRVPAGKAFYLYVTESLDLTSARPLAARGMKTSTIKSP
jgi:hypothetical protein